MPAISARPCVSADCRSASTTVRLCSPRLRSWPAAKRPARGSFSDMTANSGRPCRRRPRRSFDEQSSVRSDLMKIASIQTGVVALPNDEPLAGFSENPNAKNPIVTLRIRTDDGVEGSGVTYFGGALTRTLRRAVDELGAFAIGEDPMRVEAVAAKLRAAAGGSGPAGIFTMALSAIDVALWDIK